MANRGNRAVPLVIRALSFPQAAALFRSRLQPLAESDPEIPINLSEVKLTCSFVAEVTRSKRCGTSFARIPRYNNRAAQTHSTVPTSNG